MNNSCAIFFFHKEIVLTEKKRAGGKMNTVNVILICFVISLFATGCGQNTANINRKKNSTSGVEDVLKQGMEASYEPSVDEAATYEVDANKSFTSESLNETNASSESGLNKELTLSEEDSLSPESTENISGKTDGIDIDLTELSSTMVFSEVYSMMFEPENYVGKSIKMDGLFSANKDEETGKYYFACIIMDATACCAQGLEFEPTGDYSYPEDFPNEGEPITVEGIFDIYTEGEYRYCTLKDAVIL